MKVSKKLYNGTILDGKFIRSNNDHIFLIQDVYYLLEIVCLIQNFLRK